MLRRNKGFTLIELLVCLVIVFIGFIMLIQVAGIFYIGTEDAKQSVNVITQEQEAAQKQQPKISPKVIQNEPEGAKKSL